MNILFFLTPKEKVSHIFNDDTLRQGVPEVIYGAGKTKEQIKEIVKYLQKSGEKTVLITRMSSEAAKFVSEEIDLRYDEISKVGIVGPMPKKDGIGTIVVATAGTSDMSVCLRAFRILL